QHTHGGDLPALAGLIAVNAVGYRRRDKQRRCQQFFGSIGSGEAAGGENPDQQRNAANAGERDGVGKVHGAPPPGLYGTTPNYPPLATVKAMELWRGWQALVHLR